MIKNFSKCLIFGGIPGYFLYKQFKFEKNKNLNLDLSLNSLQNEENILNLKTRNEHYNEVIKNPNYDVLVIGGGATGSGVIDELSNRGLKGLIIDNYDFSGCTSSKSSKMLHGGVRYLEKVFDLSFDFQSKKENLGLVYEGLKERNYLLNKYPFLTDQIGLIIPNTNIFMNIYSYIGIKIYDIWSKFSITKNFNIKVNQTTILTNKDIQNEVPDLSHKYKYSLLYYDGLMNDTKLALYSILNSTIEDKNKGKIGSNALNYCEFKDFIKDSNNKIIGAVIYDKINKKEININSKYIVNSTGIFGDTIRLKDNKHAKKRLLLSEGSHITLDNNNKFKKYGLLIPKTSDGRVMFIIPYENSINIGTNDNKVEIPLNNSKVLNKNIIEIINETTNYIPNLFFEEKEFMDLKNINDDTLLALSNKAIKSKWSGIRPLVLNNNSENSKDVSRVHVLEESDSGLISIMGGKFTTFRKMGEDVSNFIVKKEFEKNNISEKKYNELIEEKFYSSYFDLRGCIDLLNTKHMKIIDNKIYKNHFAELLSKKYNIEHELALHLIKNYGANSLIIIKNIKENLDNKLLWSKKFPYTVGEVKYLLKYEFCNNSIDILSNRFRLLFQDAQESKKVLPKIIEIIGNEYNWDNKKKIKELKINEAVLNKLNFIN